MRVYNAHVKSHAMQRARRERHDAMESAHSLLAKSLLKNLHAPVTAAARATSKNVHSQVTAALDDKPFAVDFSDDVEVLSERVLSNVQDRFEDAIDRADTILGDWDGEDIDEISDQLDEGLDGVFGKALAVLAVSFGAAFAAMNQTAQEDAGVSEYVWHATIDTHTRQAHKDLDDGTYSWDDPPLLPENDDSIDEPSHPGEAPNCRCVAEPVTPET